ncbi:bifunctional Armadillo-type fold/Protein phosphatase 2A [Babesia duncani]|uniref:Bifunctional Armadillo-type fold/Protein phosphatase 2A n=1 Tax=Babesia duncani TaxID=323732 RepID=A0AAD9PLG7_9APIC|nr:bifunctional Armadillo-type fold/Protein phosphatase 2A [Babesia duncani]
MRFFRPRERSGDSDREDGGFEDGNLEQSPARSLFRSMSMIFSRSSSVSNDGSNSTQPSPPMVDVPSPETELISSEANLLGSKEYNRHSDLGHINWDTSPFNSYHPISHRGSSLSEDEDYSNMPSRLSSSLTSALSKSSLDEINAEAPVDIGEYPTLNEIWLLEEFSKSRNIDTSLPSTVAAKTVKDKFDFEIKHSTSFNLGNEDNNEPPLWFEELNDETNSKTFKRVVKQKSFFNLRSKILALRRNKSKRAQSPIDNTKNFELQTLIERVQSLPQLIRNNFKKGSSEDQPEKRYEESKTEEDAPRTSATCNVISNTQDQQAISIPNSASSIGPFGSSISSTQEPIETVIKLTSVAPPDVMAMSHFTPEEAAEAKRIEETFSSLPQIKETPLPARPELFQKKLIACQTLVNFDARMKQQRAIDLKRHTLLEIVDYISSTRNCINERVLQDVIDMLAANVFRSLPPKTLDRRLELYIDAEDEEHTLEKSWSHLQIVYDVFLRVIVSNEISSKMAKNVIDKPFVMKLLQTLQSEDQRERDYLKTILHRIYGKIMPLRNFIRKAINNVFMHFIYESEIYHGINELLEILGSIINGFAIPLKEEHKIYLAKSLLPLHRTKSVGTYHAALTYCMMQYINKDRTLAALIIKDILRYWPLDNTAHEILFINELEEVLTQTEISELNAVINSLAKRLAQCIASMHFQVAERALYMWNNERIFRLLTINKEIVMERIVPLIENNCYSHWNAAVRTQSQNAIKVLMNNN